MPRLASKSLILATVLLPLLGAPALAFALDEKTVARINHLVQCATWMIERDPRYVRFCTPSNVTQEQLHDLINFGGSFEAPTGNGKPTDPCGSSSSSSSSSSAACPT